MQTRIEQIGGKVLTAPGGITLNDLPFPRGDLGGWIGGSGVIFGVDPTLVASMVDKNTGDIYPAISTASIQIADANGFPVFETRDPAQGAGYKLNPAATAVSTGKTICAVMRRPGTSSDGRVYYEGHTATSAAMCLLDEHATGAMRAAFRRDPGEVSASIEVPVPTDTWFGLYIAADYNAQQIYYWVSDGTEHNTSAFPDGESADPLADVHRRVYIGGSSRPAAGLYSDLFIFDNAQSHLHRRMTQSYLSAMANVLNDA